MITDIQTYSGCEDGCCIEYQMLLDGELYQCYFNGRNRTISIWDPHYMGTYYLDAKRLDLSAWCEESKTKTKCRELVRATKRLMKIGAFV